MNTIIQLSNKSIKFKKVLRSQKYFSSDSADLSRRLDTANLIKIFEDTEKIRSESKDKVFPGYYQDAIRSGIGRHSKSTNKSTAQKIFDFKNNRTDGLPAKYVGSMINDPFELALYPDLLRLFISPTGRILPKRFTGFSAKHQRKLAKSIKISRQLALLPYLSCYPEPSPEQLDLIEQETIGRMEAAEQSISRNNSYNNVETEENDDDYTDEIFDNDDIQDNET